MGERWGGRRPALGAHLLGTDEIMAEAASLLLREHDDLDGLLREALRARGAAGGGRERRVRNFVDEKLVVAA